MTQSYNPFVAYALLMIMFIGAIGVSIATSESKAEKLERLNRHCELKWPEHKTMWHFNSCYVEINGKFYPEKNVTVTLND